MLDLNNIRFNEPFIKKIVSKPSKYYNEYYVLAILKHYCFDATSRMVKLDDPDLQDGENSVCVEVTEACNSKYKNMYDHFRKYRHPKDKTEIERRKKAIKDLGGELSFNETGLYYGISVEEVCSWCESAIIKKMKKLKSYKESFKEVSLALIIDYDTNCAIKDLVDCIERCCDKKPVFFDHVYIVLWSKLLCLEFNSYGSRTVLKKYSCLNMLKEDCCRCKELAKMTAMGIIDPNDAVWESK